MLPPSTLHEGATGSEQRCRTLSNKHIKILNANIIVCWPSKMENRNFFKEQRVFLEQKLRMTIQSHILQPLLYVKNVKLKICRTNLRAMLHMKRLLYSTRHYDTTITGSQTRFKIISRCWRETQPSPYMPQKRSVEHLSRRNR